MRNVIPVALGQKNLIQRCRAAQSRECVGANPELRDKKRNIQGLVNSVAGERFQDIIDGMVFEACDGMMVVRSDKAQTMTSCRLATASS